MFRKFSNPLFKCNYWLFIIQTCNHSMVTSIVYYYYPSATMDVHILDFYFLFFYITYLTLFNHSHYIWNIHFLDPLSHQHDQNFPQNSVYVFFPLADSHSTRGSDKPSCHCVKGQAAGCEKGRHWSFFQDGNPNKDGRTALSFALLMFTVRRSGKCILSSRKTQLFYV